METVINLIYVFFTFVIIARIFMSYMGNVGGGFYEFVYKYSEILLKPIRTRLPYSSVDFSPVIAIISLGFLKNIFDRGLGYIYEGDFIGFFTIVLVYTLDLSVSIINFYMLLLVIKLIIDKMHVSHNKFVYIIDYLTNPVINKINPKVSLQYRKYTIIIVLVMLFILSRGIIYFINQIY